MELVINDGDFTKRGILNSLKSYSEGIKEEYFDHITNLVFSAIFKKVIKNSKYTFIFKKDSSDNIYLKIIVIELDARR